MRRPVLLSVLLVSLAALGCQPAEQAILIDVHSQADLQSLRVVVLSLDSPRRWEEPLRRVNRTADDINGDPLRVAVILGAPEYVLVHLEGTTPDGERVIATRCYAVNGVILDDVMLFGPLGDLDLDGDGFASDAASTCREPGDGGRAAVSCDSDLHVCPDEHGADCDVANAAIYPGAPTICLDGIDQDCDGMDEPCGDQDGDGVDACPRDPTQACDCNDNVPSINPNAQDICLDGIDQDCDGIDACCDADGDGSPACGLAGPDCDDADPAIHPAATEACDGVDNNCNGQTDELDECRGPDLDGDGVAACGREEPGDPCDCNDCDRAIYAGAQELCGPRAVDGVPGNGIDEDCDGMIDEACPAGDLDGDGVEPPRDCNDADPLVFPPTGGREPIDLCGDMMANNCIPGEDALCSDDTDGDRWVEPAVCEASDAIHPGAVETCNGVDDDCDGVQDEVLSPDDSTGCVNGAAIVFATEFTHCGGCRVVCDIQRANRCLAGACDCEWNAAGGQCAEGDTCCPAIGCASLQDDEANCGVCGNACGTGEECIAGRCTCGGTPAAMGEDACPEATAGRDVNQCCAGGCHDITISNEHCGVCRHRCGDNSSCGGGSCACTPPSPAAAWLDCNGDLASLVNDGCEINTRSSDTTNCGGCGTVCNPANASPRCATGSCQINTCNTGFADCNSSPADGCETPLNTLTNCGACRVPCSRANASATCATRTCAISSCNDGFANCDTNDANGCETPLNTLSNCGGCGVPCSRANATATCATRSCAINSCLSGWANCDGNDSNGCETSLDANASCGACGNDCGANATCVSRACVCNAGRLDCPPGSPWCETAFSTSNCGACSVSCGASETCDALGRCVCGTTPGTGPGTGSPCAAGQGCCGGSCAALNTLSNCRSCGNSCDSDETCGGGGCTCNGTTRASGPACPSPASCCGDGCADLSSDEAHCGDCVTQCVTGETCTTGNCRCNGGAACGVGQTCCASPTGCVNLSNDPASCGSCGRSCRTGETCSGGNCRCNGGAACTGSQICCPVLGCVDPSSNAAACGGCGIACAVGEACCSGSCTSLATTTNCGACGAACGANENCATGGVCVCGNMAGTDPTGTMGGGAACRGATPVCCDTTSGGSDDNCAASMAGC